MAAYKEILKHNNRMGEIIYLNKVNSALEFQLNSEDSSLLIQSIALQQAQHKATSPARKTLWASLKTKTVCESQRADHPK
jgi:hypothetical protein